MDIVAERNRETFDREEEPISSRIGYCLCGLVGLRGLSSLNHFLDFVKAFESVLKV